MPASDSTATIIDEDGYPVDPETGRNLPAMVSDSINSHAIWAAATALIPIPMIEVLTNTTMQIHMISRLCDIYEVKFSEQAVKASIATFVGVVVPAGSIGTSAYFAVRAIPVVGPVVSLAVAPALSGAMTWAIGRVFAWHFERGGSLADFDADAAVDRFKREFEAGRRRAGAFVNGNATPA
ncbi:MAG: DUF697 domain-containing protein [Alphaproteobacteria bacterium]|nr:DUF697 domain-containing protein [Alphaproteobacteria bacterium]